MLRVSSIDMNLICCWGVMRIKETILVSILSLLLFVASVEARVPGKDFPRLNIGTGAGVFRLSIAHFEHYYGSRFGAVYAGHFGYAFSPSSLLLIKGRYFTKKHTALEASTQQLRERFWEERWLCLGCRRYSPVFRGDARTFFGFGLVFFFIDERKDGDFLLSEGLRSRRYRPKGFFISGGYEHYLTDQLTLCLEIELSSASLQEGNTLESQSVGGIYVGGGINLLFF